MRKRDWVFLVTVGLLVSALAVVLLMPKGSAELIGSGPVQEFELVEAPVGEYSEITVELVAEKTQYSTFEAVVWRGEIPKDALAYQVTLAAEGQAYTLFLTVRDDGIGCLPTDYPYALTMRIYGVK